MRRKKEEKPANHERWLLSYSDFMTLLMIFFVIMYAMSATDTTKYKQLAESLNGAMGGASMQSGPADTKSSIPDELSGGNAVGIDDLNSLKQKIDKYIKEDDLSSEISATITSKGLIISLKDNILFESGKAELMSTSTNNLLKLGNIIKQSNSYIRVEGHTDNIPIHNNLYKSNWELSSARATNIVRALIDNSYVSPGKICAVGYGEYRPVASNNTEEGRNKNRRVDIVIVDEKYQTVEN